MFIIDKNLSLPYYLQIYQQILNNIKTGKLSHDTVLPGTRELAKKLCVSRNTVSNAYSQLSAEGYIESIHGVGYKIIDIPKSSSTKNEKKACDSIELNTEQSINNIRYDLYHGNLSSSFFPFSLWKKYTSETLTEIDSRLINSYHSNQGDFYLRKHLAYYLYDTRGVNCSPDEIIVTSGLQSSLNIIRELLYQDQAQNFAVHATEEPGYDRSAYVFQRNNINVIPIHIDEFGANPESLPNDNRVKTVYVTPSHQMPTGIIMPIKRRYELLDWSVKNDAYIIEDDYDSEYSYFTNPIPSLKSIDKYDRVIYLGTFSKTLSPSMRIGYVVLPPELIKKFKTDFYKYNGASPWLNQRIVGKLVEHGHYQRLVRRMRGIFKKRHDILVSELDKLNCEIKFLNTGAGLNFILELPEHMTCDQLIDKALKKGVRVYSPSRFWLNPSSCPNNWIFIGIASIDVNHIPDCVQLLKEAWFE